MDVILSKTIDKLGLEGDVVNVKDGFARNYLLPRKLAFRATADNLRRIEKQAKEREAKLQKELKTAQALAAEIEKISCTVAAEANEEEKLYGSVTEAEIASAIEVEGFTVDKKQIELEKPIEEVGIFEIGVRIHPQVTAKVRLWVTKK